MLLSERVAEQSAMVWHKRTLCATGRKCLLLNSCIPQPLPPGSVGLSAACVMPSLQNNVSKRAMFIDKHQTSPDNNTLGSSQSRPSNQPTNGTTDNVEQGAVRKRSNQNSALKQRGQQVSSDPQIWHGRMRTRSELPTAHVDMLVSGRNVLPGQIQVADGATELLLPQHVLVSASGVGIKTSHRCQELRIAADGIQILVVVVGRALAEAGLQIHVAFVVTGAVAELG